MRVLLIDFYDSFTFNLAHYLEALEVELLTKRYDQLHATDFYQINAIILSPGPGLPNEKEGLTQILEQFVGKLPILGVCLGMQALVLHLGGSLQNQAKVKHGVSELIDIKDFSSLFNGLPKTIQVGLYHSWQVCCPSDWITATSKSGVPMALELPEQKVYGVQFHPESIMTPQGMAIMKNFLHICKDEVLV
ncbi:MAG: anthranilate synthase component II [Flavobacteriales bacterium]